jgi:ADP-ribose pyrophosphatase YjhB (NUDIX family)
MDHSFIKWCREIQAIAQNGLAYSENPYDLERYEQLRDLAARMISSKTDNNIPFFHDLFKQENGYATPKIDVRGAVFQDNRILLVREKSDGLWTLPGGWADINDSPSEAVTREIEEEAGIETRCVKLVALYDRNKHPHPPMYFHAYKAFFVCEYISGIPAAGVETSDVGYFTEGNYPDLSTGRVTVAQVNKLFEHYRDMSLPTEFD